MPIYTPAHIRNDAQRAERFQRKHKRLAWLFAEIFEFCQMPGHHYVTLKENANPDLVKEYQDLLNQKD